MDFSQESMKMIRLRIADELRNSRLNICGEAIHQSVKMSAHPDLSPDKTNPNVSDDDMDDFEMTSTKYQKLGKRSRGVGGSTKKSMPQGKNMCSASEGQNGSDADTEQPTNLQPQKWEDLCPELQGVLPSTDRYTYLIEEFELLPNDTFCGAPEASFEVKLRANLDNEEDTKEWLSAFMKQSKCTYRVTRSYHPKMKKNHYKLDLHCQHYKKKLTDKQVAKRGKPKSKTFVSELRNKKTQCPSKMYITVQIPPKTQAKGGPAARSILAHEGFVYLTFNHNHPLESAHVLSFRPVSAATKEKIFHCSQWVTLQPLPATSMKHSSLRKTQLRSSRSLPIGK